MSNSVAVYFAGFTGPERSGGEMVYSFTLLVNGKIQTTSAMYEVPHADGSWHTATYRALAYAIKSCAPFLRNPLELTFLTDNKMVVQQMMSRWGVKDGHYVNARDEALLELTKVVEGRPLFVWVPNNKNFAVTIGRNLFESNGTKVWSWKEERQRAEAARL